ncbi:MAG: hypothetical protein GX896_01115, partial [Clostridiales bacterium]|nr:hypothetical protein [Clostridiales bacterium]
MSTGRNEFPISASAKINSYYDDFETHSENKNLLITVEENPDPWVVAIMTATPSAVQSTGQEDIPVTLDITYGIANLKNLNLINNIHILVEDEANNVVANVTKEAALIGEHRLNVKIPKTFLGSENQKDKIYKADIKYNLKNGGSYKVTKTAVVRVYKTQLEPEPTPEPTPGPTPTPTPISSNNPPSVKLTAPSEVKAGEEFWIRASASDPDGDPLRYIWHVDNSSGDEMPEGKKSGKIWYDKKYANTVQEVQVIVIDTEGDGADDVQIINVLPPTIDARMQIDGKLKVNRKITLKDISDTPDMYDTISRKWTVTPVTSSGTTASDIKHSGDWTSESEDILFKKEGDYKVSLRVKNKAGCEDTVEKIITIRPDENPVAQFKTANLIYRDPEDDSQASIKLVDTSYSFDGDIIGQRKWEYRYDSNNNGSFSDETPITLNSSNLSEYTFKTKNVGRYEFSLTVKEFFEESTSPEFSISDSELLTDTVTQIVEVVNNAPSISLKLESKEKVDIVIAVGNTSHSKEAINEKVNSILKPMLFNKGADAKITVIEGNEETGKYYYDIYNGFADWSNAETSVIYEDEGLSYGLDSDSDPVLNN